MSERFSARERVLSFGYAMRGVGVLLRTQHNAWIHGLATICVVLAGFWLEVSASDWCWLVLAMVLVWTCEGMNTALERLADAALPEFHPLVQEAKDSAAGAVLLAAIGAIVIGLLVLGPPFLHWLEGAG